MARGAVAEFDHDAGWGRVEAESGQGYFFHCTAIADGTRTIEVGKRVEFEVVPGHRGMWEAVDVRLER